MMDAEVDRVRAALEGFDRRLRIARASELALTGRLLEAAALLELERGVPIAWDELDLLARIRVCEGKFADALKLWGQGASIPTHSSHARACIVTLQNYAAAKFKREREVFVALWTLWSAAAVGIVLVAVWRAFR